MLGLIVAFVGILLSQVTGILWFDGLASILIGVILVGTAIWLASETKGLLIGESANRRVVEGIRNIAQAVGSIEHVHEVLTMHMGPDFILVNISVKFARGTRAEDIESAIAQLDRRIKKDFTMVKRVFVEAEARSEEAQDASAAEPAGAGQDQE
jgi:divalent metal cation (Fe/Co/Zn/Cd) transporter